MKKSERERKERERILTFIQISLTFVYRLDPLCLGHTEFYHHFLIIYKRESESNIYFILSTNQQPTIYQSTKNQPTNLFKTFQSFNDSSKFIGNIQFMRIKQKQDQI